MVGKPGKGRFARSAVAAPRECDAEDARGNFRVFVECLKKIPHAKEKYRARILRFDLGVLLHERR